MTIVEMKRNFKTKIGYTRVKMVDKGFGIVKYQWSLCYPADQEGKFVEYVQNVYEMTKEEANKKYLELKKQGYESKIYK